MRSGRQSAVDDVAAVYIFEHFRQLLLKCNFKKALCVVLLYSHEVNLINFLPVILIVFN